MKNLQQLLVILHQKTAEEMHTSSRSRDTTYSYSRCVKCVYVVYMSAHKQMLQIVQ